MEFLIVNKYRQKKGKKKIFTYAKDRISTLKSLQKDGSFLHTRSFFLCMRLSIGTQTRSLIHSATHNRTGGDLHQQFACNMEIQREEIQQMQTGSRRQHGVSHKIQQPPGPGTSQPHH